MQRLEKRQEKVARKEARKSETGGEIETEVELGPDGLPLYGPVKLADDADLGPSAPPMLRPS